MRVPLSDVILELIEKRGEEVFGGGGDILGWGASNLIAGACVMKEEKERV
jgi:hypothetical protein